MAQKHSSTSHECCATGCKTQLSPETAPPYCPEHQWIEVERQKRVRRNERELIELYARKEKSRLIKSANSWKMLAKDRMKEIRLLRARVRRLEQKFRSTSVNKGDGNGKR